MSDAQILEQIYAIHVHNHNDLKFDVNSLFSLVENILKRSTHIVDNAVQVLHTWPFFFVVLLFVAFFVYILLCMSLRCAPLQGSQGSPEHIDDKIPQASFFSPLCTLKQISSEVLH